MILAELDVSLLVLLDVLLTELDVEDEEEVEVDRPLVVVALATAPGTGTVAPPSKMSSLLNVLHDVLLGMRTEYGTVPSPCLHVVVTPAALTYWPGGSCESDAQDSKTPSLALEGALNPHPMMS